MLFEIVFLLSSVMHNYQFIPTHGNLFLCCLSLCVGWSNGAECHSPIQEEIRHFFALQAYLNLTAGAPQFFKRAACLYSAVFSFFVSSHLAKSCTETSLQVS